MNAYRYKAQSPDGKVVRGVVEAYDEYEAVAQIKRECPIVLSIKEVQQTERKSFDLNEPLWVSEKVLSLVASQFAILLRAGLPIAKTVSVIAQQTTDKLMKKILTEVAQDVNEGYPLSRSLESRGKKIPLTFIETVRAGERSGSLESSFQRLADYYEKSYKLKGKVRSAMIYPAAVLALAVVVVIIVVNVCVPVVSDVIATSGGELPILTKMLLGMYDFFQHWWLAVIAVIAALIIAIRFYGNTEAGRLKLAEIALKLPVLGHINTMNAASQFAGSMATLVTAGLPTGEALSITGRVMDNHAVGTFVGKCAVGIEEGKRLGEVLRGGSYLPELLVEMAAVGEESGSLEETLATIGAYYDSEVEQASAKALSMLEPIITVVLGLIIGFIVIAMYMPMFTMYDSVGYS